MTNYFWDSFSKKSWEAVPYPWKPSFGNLCFIAYRYLLCYLRHRKCRTLLVGATLPIRSLFSHAYAPYDLIDYSSNMVSITTPKKDTLENIYINSWLNIEPNKKYDFIVGDLVLNLLDEKEVASFLDLYTQTLTKDGVLVLRTRIRSEKNTEDIQKITKESLQFLERKTLYTAFANMRTLSLFSQELAKKTMEEATKGGSNLLSVLETHFLRSDLNYYIHTRASFVEKVHKSYNLSFTHEHTPAGYVDTFCFLVIQNKAL